MREREERKGSAVEGTVTLSFCTLLAGLHRVHGALLALLAAASAQITIGDTHLVVKVGACAAGVSRSM